MHSHPVPETAPPRAARARSAGHAAAAWTSACTTLALLAGVTLDGLGRSVTAGDAGPVAADAPASVPHCVGDWVGRDVEAAPAVVAMLRPSVLLQRSYHNLRTGETASVLYVRCGDARDLMGHYPPVCYPAHGRDLVSANDRELRIGADEVPVVRYRFAAARALAPGEIVVDNFMVLPSGRFGRDMDAVDTVARDPRLRRLGAAEVQVVTDGAMDDGRRDEVFAELAASLAPLLRRANPGRGHD